MIEARGGADDDRKGIPTQWNVLQAHIRAIRAFGIFCRYPTVLTSLHGADQTKYHKVRILLMMITDDIATAESQSAALFRTSNLGSSHGLGPHVSVQS
jgi:hypothetical protein